jgi:hypothetical protein
MSYSPYVTPDKVKLNLRSPLNEIDENFLLEDISKYVGKIEK